MHVPDHVIAPSVELVAGLGAGAAIAATLAAGRRQTDESSDAALLPAPERAGVQASVAALVFALQMVNVPVLPGTSGHLLGGALAAALIGPRRALLAVSAVVAAQALLFADGGTAALGVNLWLIAILPVALVAAVQRAFSNPDVRRPSWWSAIALGAALAPVTSAAVLSVMLGASDTGVSTARIAQEMVATHLAISVAEVTITLAAAALVAWAMDRRPSSGAAPVWGLAGASALALSLVASSSPDGLERVIGDLQIAIGGDGSILSGSPFADYGVSGIDATWATSLAGGLGLLVAAGLCAVLAVAARPAEGANGAAVAP